VRSGRSAIREIEEIVEKVVELEGFTEEQQALPHGNGPGSEIEYRLAWARTYLKQGIGALDNSKRGVWSTTELGRSMTPQEVSERHAAYLVQLREARKAKRASGGGDDDLAGEDDEDAGAKDWKEQLLEQLLAIPPDRFERLARRLLREAGFVSATVTGRSGDGGIEWDRRLPPFVGQLPCVLSMQALQGHGRRRRGPRLQRRHEWARRQGASYHHG
jgi:restriction system protein